MPTLNDLTGAATDPTVIQFTSNLSVVEPLDGPTSVDDVMDRFPEEVYQQGRDTHLYRFLQALGGDAGAGFIKKQAYAARLTYEAQFTSFQVLDDIYAAQFQFNRLKSETYPYNTSTDALTPTEWDEVQLADQSYRQRIADFWTAIRIGTSPSAMATMAQASCGVECEIVENYKWIFDQFSDDPLGLTPMGTTISTAEFIVVPRFLNSSTDWFNQDYQQTVTVEFNFTGATLNNTIRPSLGGTGPSVTTGYFSTPQTRMNPDIERNVIELTDRLRPLGTLATVNPQDIKYIEVPVAGDPAASSERINVTRFVTGSADVPWPDVNPTDNFFVQAGVETEASYFYGSQRDLPVIFHTVENVHAYTEAAFTDPLYGTNEFYDASSGISDFETFRSEHVGGFTMTMAAIFPFLSQVTPSTAFVAAFAIAINNTPLVMEGRST